MAYYDRAGDPIDLMHWAMLMADDGYRQLALDEIGDVKVSTVWLGADHQFGDGPPLIFETMVLDGSEEICERYATGTEAIDGHRRICEEVRNAD